MVDAVYAAHASKRDAGADGPPYSTGLALICTASRQTKRAGVRKPIRVLALALPRRAKRSKAGVRLRKATLLATDSDNVFQLHTVRKIDVFLPLRPATP